MLILIDALLDFDFGLIFLPGIAGAGNQWSRTSPQRGAANKRAVALTPGIEMPKQDVGPMVGQGGWKSAHPYGPNTAGATVTSRPGTAYSGKRG